MQIKELNIKNFKSFDYVKIPLGKGLHVVVGPNGSGKSNITDALLFGLGTTSLKRLRVDKLSDLINHNTKAKTARVRIVIEYENQDYEIVREIDASGKSVFLLNNQRKSLNEITSFLKEIGMDVEGYNVIQQGDVLRIINLKPEERRTIIDDLSGISLFDARKKEAEDNLKKVDEKLQKVNIALNERKPYIEQLRSEKENALKYQELDSQEKLFTYNFLKKQISIYNSEIEQEQENVEKNKQAISDLIKQKREALDNQKKLEEKIEEINLALINHSEIVSSTLGKTFSDYSVNKEIILNNLNITNENLNYLISENNSFAFDLKNYESQLVSLSQSIDSLNNQIAEKNMQKLKLKEAIDKSQDEYNKYVSMQQDLYAKLSEYNKQLSDKQNKLFDKKNKLNAFIFQKDSLEKQEKEENKLVSSLETKKKDLEKDIFDLSQKLNSLSLSLSEKKKELDNCKSLIINFKEKINVYKIELAGYHKELSFSLDISKKKQELLGTLSKYKTFLGFLEDIVPLNDIQKDVYSSYVVLSNDSELETILEKTSTINLSFIILSVLGLKNSNDLQDFFKQKLFSLNGTKLKIKNLYFDGFCFKKIVTTDTKTLEKEIKKIEEEVSNLENQLSELAHKEIDLTNDIEGLQKNELNLNIQIQTQRELLKNILERISSFSKSLYKSTFLQIMKNIEDTQKDISVLEKEIEFLASQKRDIENNLKQIYSSTNNVERETYDLLVSEINSLEQALISKSSEQKMLFEKINNVKSHVANNSEKIQSLHKKITELELQKKDIDEKLVSLKKQIDEQEIKKQHLFSEKSEIHHQINNLSSLIHSLDINISDLNLKINQSQIVISTTSNKLNDLEKELKDLDILDKDKKNIDLSIDELLNNLRKIKREKNVLGNINFNAISSYESLAKEYDDILQKSTILINEKEQILHMLTEINMKKQDVFMDCFEKISSNYNAVLKKMSPTLSGELKLDGSDPFNSKLIINIIKNKKAKDIDILSTGEKTIAALAFIFALHSYKIAPLYILDEVDAALDDYNSLNLLNFMKDLAKDTTVIAISHNSEVVAGADKVIGVTLKENTSVIGLNL